jgi:NAD-dependent DNA ligase
MKYDVIDSVRVKRTRFELLTDGFIYHVAKIVGERVMFLYSSSKYNLAIKFYERTIRA